LLEALAHPSRMRLSEAMGKSLISGIQVRIHPNIVNRIIGDIGGQISEYR
jgi:hypothetical protein